MVDLVTGPDRGHRISCQNMECSRENKNKRLLASHSRAIFYWTIAVQGIGQEAQHIEAAEGAPQVLDFSLWFGSRTSRAALTTPNPSLTCPFAV
jgi:hypothetical protein